MASTWTFRTVWLSCNLSLYVKLSLRDNKTVRLYINAPHPDLAVVRKHNIGLTTSRYPALPRKSHKLFMIG